MNKVVFNTYVLCKDFSFEEIDHIEEQFSLKPEFDVTRLDEYTSRAQAIIDILKQAIERNWHSIIICEKFHDFTSNYSYDTFMENISFAEKMNVNILLGGAVGFCDYVRINSSAYWIDFFSKATFIVVFNKVFRMLFKLLNDNSEIPLEEIISNLDNNTQLIYPFISFSRDFPYCSNDYNAFYQAPKKISILDHVYYKYGLV